MVFNRQLLNNSYKIGKKLTENKVTFTSTNSYSQAFYEIGNESGSLNEIEDQVNSILKLISKNEELKNFIKNPTN